MMDALLQDLRYGRRILTKATGFTVIAVLTLALGIGASTAVFSAVNAILLKPLPYPDPDKIVLPWRLAPIPAVFGDQYPWSKRDFHLFSQRSKTFQDLGAFQGDAFNLTASGDPERLDGCRASAGFFGALGIAPALGRVFTSEEDRPGHEHVVVLSHSLWRNRFGGDPAIVGRAVELNGFSYTVVGVMPAGFGFPRAEEMPATLDFPREAQLWVPMAIVPGSRGPQDIAVIGRLKPGVSMLQANSELDVFARNLETQFPEGKGWYNCRITGLTRQVTGETRRPLLLILGAVGVVLLIACSNIASLLLARSLGRKREFTLRAALGAGQSRLIRQLLTESLLLAAAGGAVGVLFAEAAIHFLQVFGPSNVPRLRETALDPRVFAFAVCVTLITGILFGLAPALGAARDNLVESLKEGGQRAGGSPRGQKIRNALLVCEVALALVLMVGAGLLVRTFYRMLAADAGFNPERVLTFQLTLPSSKYPDADRMAQLYRRALRQLQAIPGVESAGLVYAVPLGGAPDSTVIRIPERPPLSDKERQFANYSFASSGYFAAVGTPLLRGRDFRDSDTLDAVHVTIVNKAMANKFWPGEDAVGKQVGVGNRRIPVRTIVGIVSDIKHASLREDPGPEMYVPYTQNEIKIWPSMQTMQAALRTRADPASVTDSVRAAMRSVDPDLPVAKVATLTSLVNDSMTQPRFSMLLLGAFGGLGVALACIGMYGVISYSVLQRTREIGLRMALGAERRSVFGMILGQGARLAGMGIGLGLLASLGVTRLMTTFLYGVQAIDPMTFAAVSFLLLGVALLACYVPARRAMRVDPLVALRDE